MRAVAECLSGEIFEVFFAMLLVGERRYHNGPFETREAAWMWAATSGRRFTIERRFEPGPEWYVKRLLASPRIWKGHRGVPTCPQNEYFDVVRDSDLNTRLLTLQTWQSA